MNTSIISDLDLLHKSLIKCNKTIGKLLFYDIIGYIDPHNHFNILINHTIDFTYDDFSIHVSGYDENNILNEVKFSGENAKFIIDLKNK